MEIKCEFVNKKCGWVGHPSLYTCVVKTASITAPNTRIKEFKGTHEEGKSNLDVRALEFSNSVVEYLPKGISLIFPNLERLFVSKCGLISISRSDLTGLGNLKSLFANDNLLKELPDDLFTDVPKLEKISFCSNKLEFLTSRLFTPLTEKKISMIYLDSNTKINEVFWPQHFSTTYQNLMDLIDKNCTKPIKKDDLFKPIDPSKEKELFVNIVTTGFEDLWTTGRFSDFIVTVGAKQFNVHKCVLSIQSPVFTAMFENDMKEARSGKMEIVEFSEKAVEEFLRYMYTGTLMDSKNVMELFALAAKYDMTVLKDAAESRILEKVKESNALDVLSLGNLYSSDGLKRAAFNEIKQLFKGNQLKEDLINKPEILKKLIEADRNYDQEIQDSKKKKEAMWKKLNK
jgi:BTB/POZ domain/Leucine rich repeat